MAAPRASPYDKLDHVSDPTPQPEGGIADGPEPRPTGRKRRFVARWIRRGLAVVVAIVAAVFVSFFTIDLGRFPQLTRLAEEHGSRFLDRPLHIGRISAFVTPGAFTLHDIVIEGRTPQDRPFMTIERLRVNVPWWTIFRRQIHLNVRLDNWAMVVETWDGGVHNVPRLQGPPRAPRTGPQRFTTTVDFAYARDGHFTYEDHVTPWSVVAPNLTVDFVRSTAANEYVGRAGFKGGTVQIQSHQPMATDLETRFVLDGSVVKLRHIDIVADGSVTEGTGEVDIGNWPNQFYDVTSVVDFSRMRELFFTDATWRLGGHGRFNGRFMLAKGGVRDLTGMFSSDVATVNNIEFPNLQGALRWLPDRFEVTQAEAGLLGGKAQFGYSIAPLGTPNPATVNFDARYVDVDLFEIDRLMGTSGLRLAGTATGNLALQWPNGQMAAGRRGVGRTVITPIAGTTLAPAELPPDPLPVALEPTPFDPSPRTRPLPIGGEIDYRFEPGYTQFADSRVATTHSHITFSGRMARDGTSEFPFHVTSHDWQESARMLAAIMTAVAGPTRAVEVSGRGTFDGTMTGSFNAPRIEGHFVGESMRVWDVTWGDASADLVIQGGYVEIANSQIAGAHGGTITADGRFALGYRRNEDDEEIRARVQMANWPVTDLRHAFGLDDWSMDGTVGTADLELTGRYRNMFGSGQIRIDNGTAWGESFDVATADIELEGTGMRVSRLEMQKGPGRIIGAAHIGWDGTYAFNAEGTGVPVERLDNFRLETAPLSGYLRFRATGAGEFDNPSYAVEASIEDLFVGDEGVGAVSGRIAVADDVLTIERLSVASSRLQLVGTGTIGLDDLSTSDLRFRFQETSLDPYLKFLLTNDISPYTRMVVDGSLAVKGPLAAPTDLMVEAVLDEATLTLYDYDLRNDGPIRLRFADGRLDVDALALQGRDTNLTLAGGIDVRDRTLDLRAAGDASLSILQLFFEGMTSTGAAQLNAQLTGSFDAPRLTGDAVLTDGRLRPLASPHSLEALNGRVTFGANAIQLENLTGRVGSGDVIFDGSILLDGYRVSEFNVTARGESMRLRYPAGFNSTVDMNLLLTGPANAPVLSGTIDVLRVAFAGMPSGGGLLGLAAAGATGAGGSSDVGVPVEGTGLALDIQVVAPRMAFINTNDARIEGTADLRVRGTFDAPAIEGRIDIAGGEVQFNGNRFIVREGGVDFMPNQAGPVFDLAAETRVRAAGETFTVNVTAGGTMDRASFHVSSDPWLPESDVITLLFGGIPNVGAVEERSLRASQEMQQQMMQTVGAALLARPVTSRVGRAVERTGVIDTVQITPVLQGETPFQQLNPRARVTLGQRISPRVYLTYSRTLGGLEEEIILLEYDQNDRISWVLSRNEDRTFALDFRIRHVF